MLGFEERRDGHAGTDAEQSGPVSAVVEVHGQGLPREDGEDSGDGPAQRLAHGFLTACYIIAAGGAGSSGRPALASGTITITAASASITAKPNRYDGSLNTCKMGISLNLKYAN